MPELPEVETIREDLKKRILHKKIQTLEMLDKHAGDAEMVKAISGNSIKDIERYGKLLIFVLKKQDNFLLIHLKMTGRLIYQMKSCVVAGGHAQNEKDIQNLPNSHTRDIFHFTDGTKLFFNDIRRFGYIKLVNKEEKEKVVAKYGIDPLDTKFNQQKLIELAENKSGNIKTLLMNQKEIAGIGNIYADEICFCAGVRPDRRVNSLKKVELQKIADYAKKILKLAIKHRGTSFSDYRDCEGRKGNYVKYLKVYGRTKEKCFVCGNQLKSLRVAGRGTVFCPKCQK